MQDTRSHEHRLPRLQHQPSQHRDKQQRRVIRVPVGQPADDLGGPDHCLRLDRPVPRPAGGSRFTTLEQLPGHLHQPVDVALTVGATGTGQGCAHHVAPGVLTRLVQQGQEVGRYAEHPSHLQRLGNGPEPAEGLEPGDGAEQLGLGARIWERARRVVGTEAGLLLASVSISGGPGIGVHLQGERSVGGQQLDQVRQVRLGPLVRVAVGQVLPIRSRPRARPG